MQDNELFELCKEVYERTGWESKSIDTHYFAERDERGEQVPLYTSDYLLGKLPVVTLSSGYGGSWSATDRKIDNPIVIISSSPLKALLKLVIALDDAGEMK